MPDIFHTLQIDAPQERIFEVISTPAGLNAWWTLTSQGVPKEGSTYHLGFGHDHQWQANITRYVPGSIIEWQMTRADTDWVGTRLGFRLTTVEGGGGTRVEFHHTGWPTNNHHYRMFSFCWAMYLRLFCRYIERGECIPYAERYKV